MRLPTIDIAPFARADCAALAAWLTDEDLVARTMPHWPFPLAAADVERLYFETVGPAELYRADEQGRMVAHFGLHIVPGISATIIHFLVAPELKGRGYGSASLQAILHHGFLERGLRRISLNVFDDNVDAISCYIRVGFQIEGHHRQSFRWRDAWRNHYSMAILQPEWLERRAPPPTPDVDIREEDQ